MRSIMGLVMGSMGSVIRLIRGMFQLLKVTPFINILKWHQHHKGKVWS